MIGRWLCRHGWHRRALCPGGDVVPAFYYGYCRRCNVNPDGVW